MMSKLLFKVENMSCQHCVKSIHDAVAGVVGVKEVKIDLKTKLVQIDYDEKFINQYILIEKIEDEGFNIQL